MKIVIVGSGGRLGAALLRQYQDTFDVTHFDHAQLDLSDLGGVRERLTAVDFEMLINCAAYTNVDLCESERDRAFLINADAPRVLAEICRHQKAKLIHFSTDYVFDGEKRAPYTEDDEPRPISVYGQSKRAGEENVLAVEDGHLVIRVSWVFGPDRPSFIDAMIKRARESAQLTAVADKFSTPTYTHDIAQMLPSVFEKENARGVLHFANSGQCSWQEYAQHAIDCCHLSGVPVKAKTVGALRLADMTNWVACRPVYTVLGTGKYRALTGTSPRPWRDAVADYVRSFYANK
jgi:dTDP-4-dehydrorhamnose reductase